ncbi:MAG TPA: AAA family ATPase [Acidimicrobiales bacterium]|nr:AAA family ATPase [Acidimicrobiales bacterium]
MTRDGSGRVVVLNGASSTGKTTLARTFRDRRAEAGECWLVLGIDDFFDRLPFQWMSAPGHHGIFSDAGVTMVPTPDGIRVRVGDVGRRLFAAYRRTAVTWAQAGFDVLVDDVTFDEQAADDWAAALRGVRSIRVALRCDEAVRMQRERARGDRLAGITRGTGGAHELGDHDAVLDSTRATVDELADALAGIVDRAD